MTARKAPAAPAGLAEGGRKLWRNVTAVYTLRPDELVLLEHACRTVDLIDRMAAHLDGPIVVAGSRGQPIVAPALVEVRQQRAVLAGLLKQLRLPDDAGEPRAARAARDRSDHARRAAVARWGSGG